MPKTTLLLDCRRFAAAVQACGGSIPDTLQSLLSAHEVLSRPGATEAPETAILTAALNGSLDQRALDKLLPAAATADVVNTYRQQLAARSEHHLVGQWHREMEHAADHILDSMRPAWDRHAQAIATARSLFTVESTPEHVLAGGQPGTIEAWQQLDSDLRVVNAIAAVASQFGPRGSFPQINEYGLGDQHPEDRAIMCSDGGLLADSAAFRRPDTGHRTSPWFQVPLRLHSVSSAQVRYAAWCAEQFDLLHSGPPESWIDERGQMHQKPKPRNPYRETAAVT